MKKRFLAGLLAGIMMLTLTACGNNANQSDSGADTAPAAQQDDSLPTLGADIALPTEEIAALMATSAQHDSMTIDAGKLNINPVKLYDSGTELYSMYEMLFQVAGGLGSEMRPMPTGGSSAAMTTKRAPTFTRSTSTTTFTITTATTLPPPTPRFRSA